MDADFSETLTIWLTAGGLALLSVCLGAYSTALHSVSGSVLKDLLEARGERENGFLKRVAEWDPAVQLSAAIGHAAVKTLFVLYCSYHWVLLEIAQRDASGTVVWNGISGTVLWHSGVLIVVALLMRGTANMIGLMGEERIVLASARPARILTNLLAPLARLMLAVGHVTARGMGHNLEKSREDLEEEVIAAVSDGELAGVVDGEQREMIESIFDFMTADVADIMTPRTEMMSLDLEETDVAQAIRTSLDTGHSRLPVHHETRDNIIGIFYARDALRFWDAADGKVPPLKDILHNPIFVPETKQVSDLLKEMQKGHTHMVIVLDEYGGTAGLATIEDVLEEIVGDIHDEFDKEEAGVDLRKVDPATLVAEAHVHVRDVNEALDMDIIPEDDDYETLGGFVLDNLGHIPKADEQFTYKSLSIRVLSADERKVGQVRIHRDREQEEE